MTDVTYPSGSRETSSVPRKRPKDGFPVLLWLYGMVILVAVMVLVGGATRLTDSGLSITEWAPLRGALPPLSSADWDAAFEAYKTTTEYAKVNSGMSLDAFRTIYWWEWGHRFLGRLIGLAFLLPFLVFWLTGRLSRAIIPRLGALFLLGGLQGAIGWWMVKSGLVDRVDVSQYRLAIHLTLACAILAAILWVALGTRSAGRPAVRPVRTWAVVVLAAVAIQIFLGGLVAGLDAGLVYNSWPLMDGAVVPTGLFEGTVLRSLFEDVKTVQFVHRMAAYTVLAVALIQLVRVSHAGIERAVRISGWVLAATVLLQLAIGIATLLNGAAMNWGLAHQAGALLVLGAAVYHLHFCAGRLPYRLRARSTASVSNQAVAS